MRRQIGDHGPIPTAEDIKVAIGADHHLTDLRGQALRRPLCQRLTVKRLQPLVDASHAASAAAGQHQTGDGRHRRRRDAVGVSHQ